MENRNSYVERYRQLTKYSSNQNQTKPRRIVGQSFNKARQHDSNPKYYQKDSNSNSNYSNKLKLNMIDVSPIRRRPTERHSVDDTVIMLVGILDNNNFH